MYKCRIYSNQFDLFHFFRNGFQSDLETGKFALADSKIFAINVGRCQNTAFYSDVTKTGNGEWGMGNGEWGMDNGEWGMGNGEWGMGNGEWEMGN